MEKYTYLLVNFCSIIICFLFSFHPKVQFNRHFVPFFKAAFLVAVPYILWDAYFTNLGVWWFNNRYLTGMRLLGLPIEEWLFFLCIPFACTYSYFLLNKYFKLNFNDKWFTPVAIIICVLLGYLSYGRIYTFSVFCVAGLTLIYLKFMAKVNWLGEFFIAYSILLLPFFIVNGILTGTGLEEAIVNYNSSAYFGVRIFTVPVEDAVYGFTLIIWNIYFYKMFLNGEN